MKNLKKIVTLLLLVTALCIGLAIGAVAEDEYTGTMEELNTLVAALDGEKASLDSYKAVAEYLPTVDPASDGYADTVTAVQAKALAQAQVYLTEMASEAVASTANNQIAVNRFNAFIKLGLCDADSDDYKALMTDAEARIALQAEAKEANRQAMLGKSTLSDYNLSVIINSDLENGENPFRTTDKKGVCKVDVKDGALHIVTAKTDAKTSAYVQHDGWADLAANSGVVIDFDFANFGDVMTRFHLEGGGHNSLKDDSRVFVSYFSITSDGVKTGDYAGQKVVLKNAVVTGEWLHFTVIYDPVSYTFSLYCEYELLDSYTAEINGHRVKINNVRFATDTEPVGHHAFDNVQVYAGTTLRDLNMFQKMSAEEKFVYYANYYTNDESNDILGRYTSQKNVNAAIDNYLNEDGSFKPFEQGNLSDEEYAALLVKVQQAIEKVNSFDATEFISGLKRSNCNTFIEYVGELGAIKRELNNSNIDSRAKAVKKIEDFLISTDGIIEESDEYKAAFNTYLMHQRNRYVDENILVFNKYMEVYTKVETLSALRKYYNLAKELYEDESYPINPEDALLEGFEAFAAAYELYSNAERRIEGVERDQNSKKILSCYSLISVFDQSEWDANYDYINPYVVTIRNIISSGYYNFDYEGVDKIIDAFEPMDDHFYSLLQDVHIAEISARLDFVYNNDAYIEKMGTLSYITRYLESNDIDRENPEMAALIANYETALDELKFREDDYETVLKQNASYFVSLVEKMRISDNFNEKRELYDKATGFYFALDASEDDVKAAIKVFDEHTLYFETGETSSKLFLDAVVILRTAETEQEKYAALVDCYIFSADAVLTYDGVKEAMEYYTAEYNAYNSAAVATIEVIENIGVTVGSVRANCGVNSIIAVIIKKIFE